MKNADEICVVVQSRLSSQRVPGKMTRKFADTTLFDIACEKLNIISNDYDCYVSVYEQELKDIANKYLSIGVYERSKESSECDSDVRLMYEWCYTIPYRYVVMFNPCLPFLKIETILDFIEKFRKNENLTCNLDSLSQFAVFPKKDYFWRADGTMLNKWPEGQDLFNTKAVDYTLQAAHALYAGNVELLANKGIWMCKMPEECPSLYPVAENECLDIDYEWQFQAYSELYKSGWRP